MLGSLNAYVGARMRPAPKFPQMGGAYASIKAKIDSRQAPREVIMREVNLHADPFPVPHPLDAGPELGTFHGVITMDPETDGSMWAPIGIRFSQDVLGCLTPPYKHIAYHQRNGNHWEKGHAGGHSHRT